MSSFEDLRARLHALGQEHLLAIASTPSTDPTIEHPLLQQIANIDLEEVIKNYRAAHQTAPLREGEGVYEPVTCAISSESMDEGKKQQLRKVAFDAMAAGEVAAVIMSGGQGTRLGFSGPKGMYDIGLPSHKSIFQLHVEKISRIKKLVALHTRALFSVPIYIMTSSLNHDQIQQYFRENNFFDYPKGDVIFFQQGLVPSFDFEGKVIVESDSSLSLSPDGNGGIYRALAQAGCLEHMKANGVKHLHIYGIDNVLTRALDPYFLGACIADNVQCGNKVVWRAHKAEKVGVTAQLNGKMHILEYSEIPTHLAEESDACSGKLLFGAANICNHYLSVAFLDQVVLPNLAGTYHIAKKKIPYWDQETKATVTPSAPNGIKIEMFIFDVFPMAERWLVYEGTREEDFAPVKNAPGSAQDSPDTARTLLSAQAKRWLEAVGAKFTSSSINSESSSLCEISSLLSYEGENLESYAGREITLPCYMH